MPAVKRTILVTGVSSGIGRAVARMLLNQGHQVIGISRGCQQLTHSQFISVEINLADLAALPNKFKQLTCYYPEIAGIIFAAGYGKFGCLEEFSYTQIESLIAVNLTSQIFLTRAFLPQLKQKKRADLIYIGSEAALKGSRQGTIYCASKFALRGFTQALREECAKSHIKVGLINPGMVKSNFFNHLNFEPGQAPEQHLLPKDVANAVNFILKSTANMVVDELNLNPLHKVVHFKK
jgi:NADP-dependent 3-hydroxy acid dehydrogenase YdfG